MTSPYKNSIFSIMDLERARDELLLEMHKQGNSSGNDNSKIQGAVRKLSKAEIKHKKIKIDLFQNSIFADVDPLVRKLHENIRYIAARALEMCNNSEEDGPTGVVSALRIVEREERWGFCFYFQEIFYNQNVFFKIQFNIEILYQVFIRFVKSHLFSFQNRPLLHPAKQRCEG